MIRTASAILLIAVGGVVPAAAELRFASLTSAKPAAATGAAETNPMYAAFGEMMLQMIVPDGPVEMTAIVGEKGARMEYPQGMLGLPAGTVTIMLPGGDLVVLNPKNRTYWKTTSQEVAEMWRQLGAEPVVTHKRTGEFATIAGVRAERLTFEWSLAFPMTPEAKGALPPGSPAAMKMTGEIWIAADRYTQYAPMAFRSNSGLASLGMTKLLQEGLVLRSVLRSPSFGGKEIETIVTSIAEEPAPANAFEIPAGYKLVPGGGQV